MKRKGPFVVYGLVGVALMIALIAAPGVWATTGQSDNAQTVPTRTPVPPPVQVTEPPEEENTPVPPTNTPAPPASTTVPPALATTQPRATAAPTAVPVATRSAVAPVARDAAGSAPLELPATGGCIQP